MSEQIPHIEPVEVSDEEIVEVIRREAHEYLGMTFDELVAAYQDDTLEDGLHENELAMLLYFLEVSGGIPGHESGRLEK